ncbi:phage holin family protein [Polynucleobacter sp. MWH-Creno-3A4]|uniref:phage holin family protein n=1 Tax=Polynucleobacter sp. MWH-Creno-3A4 TaxID=1855886 RepID=UPI001C0B0FBE|nr:phage holin family protein [Polynucleobacter sp. MWH-Creno-3A4]MBU3606800.1 phage holin family protein [Polynucleobacter sp. MWH-Creno-3A4]
MSQENLLSSIKNLAATGASIAQTRLELLSVDVQIARNKFISLLVMIVCALFFLFFGLVMLALFIVIYSWESDRMTALGLLTGAFISIGLILAALITQSLRTMPKLFEASIAELAKDREALSR